MIQAFLTSLIIIILYSIPVAAQMACGERAGVIAKLDRKYGEVRHGGGLAGPRVIFEIWVSCKTSTWTILRTTSNGWTCVIATGENWQDDFCKAGKQIQWNG